MNNDQPHLPVDPNPARLLSRESQIALAAGLLMGLVVAGIAEHHPGSLFGLVVALTYVLSASVSLVMFLLSWPSRPAGLASGPSVHAWLGMQGLGVLAALQGLAWF